jgi:hypothetical protein
VSRPCIRSSRRGRSSKGVGKEVPTLGPDAILTNGTTLGDRAIFNAVRQIDIKCVKLDAGRTWMNRPREDDQLKRLLSVWAEIPNLTLQSLFQ